LTPASVIALAEQFKVTEVATLDRRHFHAVTPAHVSALTLLPIVGCMTISRVDPAA
jgi:uncharacterized protein